MEAPTHTLRATLAMSMDIDTDSTCMAKSSTHATHLPASSTSEIPAATRLGLDDTDMVSIASQTQAMYHLSNEEDLDISDDEDSDSETAYATPNSARFQLESPTDGLLESIDTAVNNLVKDYHLMQVIALTANASEKKAVKDTQNAFSTNKEHEEVMEKLKAILHGPQPNLAVGNAAPGVNDESEDEPTLTGKDDTEDRKNYLPVNKLEALEALTNLQNILHPKREVKGSCYTDAAGEMDGLTCKGTSDTHKSWGRSKDIYQLYINTGSRLTWGRSKEKEVKDQTQVKQLFK
ncbi:hypothetical protein BJ165DRAFT_1534329 [Panaeolus papilionaceus]|nr:hypothetical protein BJ165DRAFT_1534329 [Panaeolus papilionaceus]